MILLPILVYFLAGASIEAFSLTVNDAESFYGLAEVVTNLVNVDNTDTVIISDFELKQQVRYFEFYLI